MRVVRQTEISNSAVGAERELREKDKQLQWAVKDEKQRTNDIVADMTRQYKATSDELMHQTNELDAKSMANDNEIKELTAQRDQIKADHKQIEENKDGQIQDLKKQIDKLQVEFGKMLNDTLQKIKNKIEVANKQWEDENDTKMMKNMEMINNRSAAGQN